jgi:hypothetical protein
MCLSMAIERPGDVLARRGGRGELMTGINVSVQRNGRWESIELDRLTDAELESWAARQKDAAPFDGYRWAVALAKWVRDRVGETGHSDSRSPIKDIGPPGDGASGRSDSQEGERP